MHFSQMQGRNTRINRLRIDSPARQPRDRDPHFAYIGRREPEFGMPAYPAPVVDERSALARAHPQPLPDGRPRAGSPDLFEPMLAEDAE